MSGNFLVAVRIKPGSALEKHRLAFLSPLNDHTELPPERDLVNMRYDLENQLLGIDRDEAKEFARLLFGSYPKARCDDPKAYIAGIISLFHGMPADIVGDAVDRVSRARRYLPNRAEVAEVLDPLVKARKEMRAHCMRMLQETERRKREFAEYRELKAHKASIADKTPQQLIREAADRLNMKHAGNPSHFGEMTDEQETNSNPRET